LARRVVVTGLGLITPVGNSVETTWAALMSGRNGVGPIQKFDTEKFSVKFAAEVKDFDPLKFIPKKEARKMGAFIHYAIAAATEAMADSGFQLTEEESFPRSWLRMPVRTLVAASAISGRLSASTRSS